MLTAELRLVQKYALIELFICETINEEKNNPVCFVNTTRRQT